MVLIAGIFKLKNMQGKERLTFYALFVLVVAASGGFLFGYHTAIISGILGIIGKTFYLSTFDEGFLVSIVLLGGILGALGAGSAADRWGRKKVQIVTAIIFCIGTLIQAQSISYLELLMGRLLTGFAVGISSVVAPLYLAEVAPPHLRGAFISTYQLLLAGGILVSYGVNLLFSRQDAWRIVFYLGFIPSFLQLICLFFVPETPGWLLRHAKKKAAINTLSHLRSDDEWETHLDTIKQSAAPRKKWHIRLLTQSHYTRLIFVGVLLSIFQQITGINTVIYYAPKIFSQSGDSSSLLITFFVGGANFLFTVLAVLFLDKLGRRLMLLIGVSAMIIGQILLASGTNIALLGIIGAFIYIFGFAIGLGPVTWVILSEIYPLKIRGQAMGLAIFANWLFNFIVSLTFLLLINKFGMSKTFLFYGFISLICLFFIYFFIPETKGKSLEEIERLASQGKL